MTQTNSAPDTRDEKGLCTDPALLNDWHVIAFSHDLHHGALLPVRLLGRDLVLWRDDSEQAHVWEDLCIHRGAPLSKGWIADNCVVCPYHGWRYDGTAQCVLVPAAPHQPPPLKARAIPFKVVERYGMVWASLGEPKHQVPVFPEWQQSGFRNILAGPYMYKANGFRAVENFVDATHFPFVHAGLNGVPSAPDRLEDYDVFEDESGISTSEIRVFQPVGDHRGVPIHAGYTYHCFRPLVAYFSKRVEVADPNSGVANSENDRFCTFFAAQPLDEVNCVIRLAVAINFATDVSQADILRRQDKVFNQDRDIVELQRPERIPIDLREELHHRTDKFGLTYRRWLHRFGIQYGTA
jgi:phenylpropionate dioxygenase-like ring-hydroxylating dioxygenase large terminal subunit